MFANCGLFDPADEGGEDQTPIEVTTADNEDPNDRVCACAPDNENIYVMSDDQDIWTFDPEALSFRFITHVACGEQLGGSKAMGISRKGRAWIEFHSGDIHTVDLTAPGAATTACKDPGFDTYYDPMFAQFGMAFVANSAADRCEKLYLNTSIPPEVEAPMGRHHGALGVIDPITLTLSRVGPIDFTYGELTGTRDGRIFAFLPGSDSHLREYDKDDGTLLGSWPLPGLGDIAAYSFTFWGGYFYFFTAGEPDTMPSRVTRYDFTDIDGEGMVLRTVIDEAPIRVVAAGVSTCAPSCPRSWRAACSR